MHTQLCAMLALQDKMNTKVHPQWRDQQFPWYRAIWTESAELLDHYGWKWWKAQQPDMAQIQLELVDIWHFGLSILLQNSADHAEIARQIEREWDAPVADSGFHAAVETLVAHTLRDHTLSIPVFCAIMRHAGLSFESLYRQYIGKNVLNFFRQDSGYQQGTYIKIWHGREDNVHLAEILAAQDPHNADFADQVYAALKSRYPV